MQLFEQLLLTTLVTTAAYSMVTLGFALILVVNRVFHFAHAGLILVPAYAYAALHERLGTWPALVAALACGALAGMAVEDGVYRPLRSRNATSMTMLVASLGIMTLLQGAVGAIFGTEPAYSASPVPTGVVTLDAAQTSALDLAVIAAAVVVGAGMLLWLRQSRMGRAVLAVAEEPNVARTVGISATSTRRVAAGLGTAVGGVGALYLGLRSGVTPTLGDAPLMFAFAGAVVGGLGRIGGSVLGLALLVTISTFATHWVATFWTLPIAFIVLVLFLFLRPGGLLGLPKRSTAL